MGTAHWQSSRHFDPNEATVSARDGSRNLLLALCEHHPEHMPKRMKREPVQETPPGAEIVQLPVAPTIESVFDKSPPIKMIVMETAKFYGLSMNEIASDRRHMNIVNPRHVATWLCKELTTASFPKIGKYLGGRDHTTCIHAIRRIKARLDSGDDRLADEIQIIKLRILDSMYGVAA